MFLLVVSVSVLAARRLSVKHACPEVSEQRRGNEHKQAACDRWGPAAAAAVRLKLQKNVQHFNSVDGCIQSSAEQSATSPEQ